MESRSRPTMTTYWTKSLSHWRSKVRKERPQMLSLSRTWMLWRLSRVSLGKTKWVWPIWLTDKELPSRTVMICQCHSPKKDLRSSKWMGLMVMNNHSEDTTWSKWVARMTTDSTGNLSVPWSSMEALLWNWMFTRSPEQKSKLSKRITWWLNGILTFMASKMLSITAKFSPLSTTNFQSLTFSKTRERMPETLDLN